MTDRDTFAAAALTGLLVGIADTDALAVAAYKIADAMLRERERVTEPITQEKRAEVSQRQPQPTLTDTDRKAIEIVAEWAEDHLGEDDPGVIALRSLLERTK